MAFISNSCSNDFTLSGFCFDSKFFPL